LMNSAVAAAPDQVWGRFANWSIATAWACCRPWGRVNHSRCPHARARHRIPSCRVGLAARGNLQNSMGCLHLRACRAVHAPTGRHPHNHPGAGMECAPPRVSGGRLSAMAQLE
jgi:hypothetical protein